jgi:hypothetical protein
MLAEIARALGALLSEILPLLFDEWRKPDVGERVEATDADREITEAMNDEWDRQLEGVDLPPDYDLPR